METYQKGIIYGLEYNDRIIYIGKSFGNFRVDKLERKKEHFRHLKYQKHFSKELQEIYNNQGENSINFKIVSYFDFISDSELLEIEIFYIKKYNTYDNGLNNTIGGSTVTGMSHSFESKEKISLATRGENNPFYGKKHSDKTKKKLSEIHKGKTLTQEQKDKVSQQWKGKPKSEDHRKKISEGLKGRVYSEETLQKMSKAKIGKKWSEESKRKRTLSIRKLTDEQVKEIHHRANNESISNRALGKEYGVGQTIISNIKTLKLQYIREIVLHESKSKDVGGL